MASSNLPAEPDSVTSTPRSEHQLNSPFPANHHPNELRVRFMCSFGGRILPRPHDNQLRYVGGDTRIFAVHRSTSFSALQSKLSKLSNTPDITLKYQLPNEDLDALISVTTDEDVDNMMEEYDRLTQGPTSKTPRLRLFLFRSLESDTASISSSIGSLLDGSSKRESWFLDALNGGLERGRSEVSSIVSEVPDYLFGLDNSDEPKPKTRPVLSENVSVVSDPGSPAPPVSSPYGSSSSHVPDLPPVKTNPEIRTIAADMKETQMGGDPGLPPPAVNPAWHYLPEPHHVQPMPVYYVPAGNVPFRPVPVHVPYGRRVGQPMPAIGQIPMGFTPAVPSQLYGAGMPVVRPGEMTPVGAVEGYEYSTGVIPDGVGVPQQQMYYAAARNTGAYPTAGIAVGAGGEMQGASTEMMMGGVSHSH